MASAAKQAAQGLTSVAMGAANTSNRLHQWGESLSERQRYLTEFNGGIAASFAQLEANRIGRSVERGGNTQVSTKFLNTSLDRLEEKLLPYQAATTNIIQTTAGIIIDKLSTIITTMELAGTIVKSQLPKSFQLAIDGVLAGLNRANQNNLWGDSTAKAMIDIANAQPKRRAVPPGGR